MKKIEIIIDKAFLNKILPKFDEAGIGGYSVIEVLRGKGDANDETVSSGAIFASKSVYILSIAEENSIEPFKRAVLPFISDAGGVFIVSTPDFIALH